MAVAFSRATRSFLWRWEFMRRKTIEKNPKWAWLGHFRPGIIFLFWTESSNTHCPAGAIILTNKGSIKKTRAAWFGQCFAILTKQKEPRGFSFSLSLNWFVSHICMMHTSYQKNWSTHNFLIHSSWSIEYFVTVIGEVIMLPVWLLEARSPVFSHLSSTLLGLSTIRAFKVQQTFQQMFDEYQDIHSGKNIEIPGINTLCFEVNAFLCYLCWLTEAWFLFLTTSRWLAVRVDGICSVFVTATAFACLYFRDGTIWPFIFPRDTVDMWLMKTRWL